MTKRFVIGATVALGVLANGAIAGDNFDSYTAGSVIVPQGGWESWDNNPAWENALVSSAFSLSAPNSLCVDADDDVVQQMSGATSGAWTFTAQTYIPTGATGQSYVILLNTYVPDGNNASKNWSTQIQFDHASGLVASTDGNNAVEGTTQSIVLDTWVEIKVMIDLDADTQTLSYGGLDLITKSWTEGVSGGGAVNIAALDLFSVPAGPMYVDDILLVSTSTTLSLVPDAECYDVTPPLPGVGDTVTVAIDLAYGYEEIVGGQFFLEYDESVLEFVSAEPGDTWFTEELFLFVDEDAGTIDYAVNIDFGPWPLENPTTMAVLTFTAIGEACDTDTLVTFRANDPPTQLTILGGDPLLPPLVGMTPVTLDSTPPVITCPTPITVNADAGFCTALVDLGTSVLDNCDPDPDFDGVRDDALPLGDPYPEGDTLITWTATDFCGNESMCVQTITVSEFNELVVDVELSPTMVAGPLERCITFIFSGSDPTKTVTQVLTFTGGVAIDASVLVPCGAYDCIEARDTLHTTQRAQALVTDGALYTADFTASADWLVGGNLNDDQWVDILDFGVFIGQLNVNYGTGDTDCDTPFPHADVNGDGMVGTIDYLFISANFLSQSETCAPMPARGLPADVAGAPVVRISVEALKRRGLGHLAIADLNRDGWLDEADMSAFGSGARP